MAFGDPYPGPYQYPYNRSYTFVYPAPVAPQPNTGWQCPKCGRCYAPVQLECHSCNATITEEPPCPPMNG